MSKMPLGGTIHPTNIERVNFGRKLGATLTYIRTRRKLTQAAAARRVGVKIETLRAIEQGDRIPTRRERERFAKAYNFRLDDLPKMLVMNDDEYDRIREIAGIESATHEFHRRLDGLALRRIQRQLDEEEEPELTAERVDPVDPVVEPVEAPTAVTLIEDDPMPLIDVPAPLPRSLEDLLDPDFALDLRLAALLRQRRVDLGLTLDEVAEMLFDDHGITSDELTHIERDLTHASAPILQALSIILDLPVEEVLTRAGYLPSDIIRYFRYHPDTVSYLRMRA